MWRHGALGQRMGQQEERCCDGYNADGQDWIKRRASRFRARYQWLDRLAAVG